MKFELIVTQDQKCLLVLAESYNFWSCLVVRVAKVLRAPGLLTQSNLSLVINLLSLTGTGVVTNAFADRNFNTIASVDNDPKSNAAIKEDICDFDPSTLPSVDCVWASPDCSTYSALTHGHRVISKREHSKTDKAHHHDEIFSNLIRILLFVLSKNPQCIIIIENPATGSLNSRLPCK